MTGGPSAGPASAYPTLRRPASICFIEGNEVFVPGLIAGTSAAFGLLDCASAEPNTPSWVAAMVMAPVLRKRRRFRSIFSNILIVFIDESPWSCDWVLSRASRYDPPTLMSAAAEIFFSGTGRMMLRKRHRATHFFLRVLCRIFR